MSSTRADAAALGGRDDELRRHHPDHRAAALGDEDGAGPAIGEHEGEADAAAARASGVEVRLDGEELTEER